MAAFVKFNCFVEDLAEKQHNLGSDTLKVYLTNEAPAATDTIYQAAGDAGTNGPKEIAAGNGYSAGGNTATQSSSAQTSGTYKLVLADPTTWTASGGAIAQFRYAVLYNDTSTSKSLIGYWDYGQALDLNSGETFTVDFDPTSGVLTIA